MRSEIIELIALEPMTIAQVAKQVKESPNRVYYHVTELEKAKLIRVVKRVRKGNLIEKVYQAVAPWIRVDERLFQGGPRARGLFHESVQTILDSAASDLGKLDDEAPLGRAVLDHVLRTFNLMRLEQRDIAELSRRLKNLVTEFKKRERPELPKRAALTVVFYPHPAKAARERRRGPSR